ncbi:hypothetical protein [Streptomonospora nanhaiensis]|uniref:hypothetical protein n=1 Tax=Streptomonospora nanhaiensis TaxID=1323731 RepID=UPI001C381934|nr:hypothetical protein [Streptomonospora nanhaiensis]MBV2364284.1 hypothetical protein [Streptomonospora nanhaiensis]
MPTPELAVMIDDTPVPLADCHWVMWAPCGCPVAVCTTTVGEEVTATVDQAWARFYAMDAGAREDRQAGYTVSLVSRRRWDQEVSPRLGAPCPHKGTTPLSNAGRGAPLGTANEPARVARDEGLTNGTLRARIAGALREHYLVLDRRAADADGNLPCCCGGWREPGPMGTDEDGWDAHLADAVMAVVAPEIAERDAVVDPVYAAVLAVLADLYPDVRPQATGDARCLADDARLIARAARDAMAGETARLRDDLDAITAREEAAFKEVDRLCEGGRWTMRVPVEDTDSDVVIGAALADVRNLVGEVRRLRADLDAADGFKVGPVNVGLLGDGRWRCWWPDPKAPVNVHCLLTENHPTRAAALARARELAEEAPRG